MTPPDSRDRKLRPSRTSAERLRDRRRRKDRRLITESLEQRQLLAGPDLIGIQPNEGALILSNRSNVLNVSPRELVFHFDDESDLDPLKLAEGIRITRAGANAGFESATAITDLSSSGQIQLEFRASITGAAGNGVEVRVGATDRGNNSSQVVGVTVNAADRIVEFDLNSNALRTSTVRDLISAVENNTAASSLIEVVQVSGPSLFPIGQSLGGSRVDVELAGANAAQFETDLGTGNQVLTRFVSTESGADGVGTGVSVSVGGTLTRVESTGANVQVTLPTGATVANLLQALNSVDEGERRVFAQLQVGSPNTVLTSNSSFILVGASDTVVEPGFIGLGDSPHEVVFRFAEELPQDTYQIDVFGAGLDALTNVNGEPVNDGQNFTQQFTLNRAPQIAAVVPTPVRVNDGVLNPELNVIEVHFNNDLLDVATVENENNYQLHFGGDTVTNQDDFVVRPNSVTFDSVAKVARLQFSNAISRLIRDPSNPTQFLGGDVRLRVGFESSIPVAPVNVPITADPGDSFANATTLDPVGSVAGATTTVRISGEQILNEGTFDLQFPGGSDVPGVRNIRPEDITRLDRTVPLDVWRREGDSDNGIATIFYDFPSDWLGDNPNQGRADDPQIDKVYQNLITDQQKQRVREVLSLYSQYLGLQFIETGRDENGLIQDPGTGPHISIALGEIYGATSQDGSSVGGITVATRPLDPVTGLTFIDDGRPDPLSTLLVMDFQDFDESVDDQLGGEFFRGAFLGVGQLLGYGYSDHLPQPVTQATRTVLNPGADNEALFPSPSDIVNGQFLFRPESNDIDLYQFDLQESGTVSIQTIAERLESASLLDTSLRLYQSNGDGWVELAANDDYFSNDSLIELELAGNSSYMIGVSASGNSVYDPSISGTGIGGLSEGQYDLQITFRADQRNGISDGDGLLLDGDLDGRAGGVFDYWFQPSDPVNTLYVHSGVSGQIGAFEGTTANPFTTIGAAFAAAQPGDQVRVAGGSYSIGSDSRGLPLQFGEVRDIEVPQGVQLVIDAGSTFLMQNSRIGVGSTTDAVDRSDASIQILGTPGNEVDFRSFSSVPDFRLDNLSGQSVASGFLFTAPNPLNAEELRLFRAERALTFGQSFVLTSDMTNLGSNPARAGDWGGIDIRADIDAADGSRINPEEDYGVFPNHIQYADIRHGGGVVDIDGRNVAVSPIEMAVARATVINSRITNSADAAIAATPDTFAETRFDEYRFQRDGAFTPDYMRLGPHIRGNEIFDNSINGLFIRIETRSGESLEDLEVNARFDDSDIVHVLAENLLIEGSAGGNNASVASPSVLQVNVVNGSVPGSVPASAAGYEYRLTFVNREGYESEPSDPVLFTQAVADNSSIDLNNLPALTNELRNDGFIGRRLYRSPIGTSNFVEVARLNSSDTRVTDTAADGPARTLRTDVQFSRFDPSLRIDPGTVLKLSGARIDVLLDGHLFAEGTESLPVVMTSLSDSRYGAGGTFETNQLDGADASLLPGDWGGVYVAFGGEASLDHTTIAGGGGSTRVEGGFGSFNVLEVHQGDLRVANSRFEDNGDGRGFVNDPDDVRSGRVGRGDNASGTIFARGSQPVIINNDFVNGKGPVMSFDINSFTFAEEVDYGRSTGSLDAMAINGNSGPLIQNNRIGSTRFNDVDPNDPTNRNFSCSDALQQNSATDIDGNIITCTLNGLEVRGGAVATEVVLDDVDIVHIVRDTIEVPNQHIYGGLRLESDARGSLVVKFQNQDLGVADTLDRRQAGIVVGGTLVTAEDEFLDIDDRIGGSLQIVGHPDFPVVLTSLVDDTIGAGFTPDGRANIDTDNNDVRRDANGDPIFVLTSSSDNAPPPPPGLPLSIEYDRTNAVNADNANVIDDDVDQFNIGFFESEIEYGGQVVDNIRVTYDNRVAPALGGPGPLGPLQVANYDFLYTTYIDVDARPLLTNPPPLRLADTMGANGPLPVLIGEDRVRSSGTFVLDAVATIDPTAAGNANPRRLVEWTAESFYINNRATLYTSLTFETRDGGSFTDSRVQSVEVISYLDQGIDADDQDVLYQKGTPGDSDFRALAINRDPADRNNGPLIGFSHGGIYENDRLNQDQATYVGWIADDAVTLENTILQDAYFATIDGNIDAALVNTQDPQIDDQTVGTEPRAQDNNGLFGSDIGTAFVWELNGDSDEAKVTTFVEFLPSDPVSPTIPSLPPSLDGIGTWDGVTIREAASDANVYISSEIEPSNLGNVFINDTNQFNTPGINEIPGQSQFLGELASEASGGDNVRRLGFIVEGAIAVPSDLDVYSFIGEAGTQVWLDVDRTNSRLDTVIELIDENGNVRVLSDNSIAEEKATGPTVVDSRVIARSLGTAFVETGASDSSVQDLYSTNARDPGMRVVLPGNVGQRFLYHVRVRSGNGGDLLDPSQVRDGRTSGAYQLQIRLKEEDVFAGTQIRYSDVRFATNGVQVIGGPNHSPLVGDEFETAAPNDVITQAQRLGLYESFYDAQDELFFNRNANRSSGEDPLGNLLLDNPASPLASDRLAKSISGFVDGATDVDWFQFEIGYEKLTRDSAALLFSTVFDVDYADGAARANTAIYVFNEFGELVLIGTDSNIADDQPGVDTDVSDLSRGSLDTGDPFIGAAELSEGTYFVALANESFQPSQLDQFSNPGSVNPLLRLEPIDSITRIVEDRIYRETPLGIVDDTGNYFIDVNGNASLISLAGSNLITQEPITTSTGDVIPVGSLLSIAGGEVQRDLNGDPVVVGVAGGGTASAPEVPVLFDGDSIIEHAFDDVLLYVNTGVDLHVVNPFTGARYVNSLGNFGGEVISDVAFRANGELFGYTDNVPPLDATTEYVRIDTSDASLTTVGTPGITTFHLTNFDPTNLVLDANSDDGIQVEAIAIGEFLGSEDGYFVGNRPDPTRTGLQYTTNILYDFDDATGQVTGPTYDRSRFAPGAGTDPREVGQIDTAPAGTFLTQLGITNASEISSAGTVLPSLFDGDSFTLSNVTESATFEFDQGFTISAGLQPVRDGESITIDGVTFEFNAGQRLEFSNLPQTGFLAGTTVTVGDLAGTTTFEFVTFGQPSGGNVAVSLLDNQGASRTINAVVNDLANQIQTNVPGVDATATAAEVVFGVAPTTLLTSGQGVAIVGDPGLQNPGATEIVATGSTTRENVIRSLADAIRDAGIPVAESGTQLSLPTAATVVIDPDPTLNLTTLTQIGAPGVTTGNIPILLLPTDDAATIAQRIAIAVQQASDSGDLPNVTAIPNGRSLNIAGGFVVNATGNLVAGGLPFGGQVTGIEIVNDLLYAVTSAGGLFEVSSGELNSNGNRTIGRYVNTATDLVGINFTGLRAGPKSVDGGALSDILFGITGSGQIFAFNTRGELQPVFAGGRSSISTGVGGALGLDFSVVDFNLWHVSGQQGNDPGHGINELFNDSRPSAGGGSSLAFTYENIAFGGNFPSIVERPTFAPRLDGTTFEDSYNVPGGTKGVIQSNEFSLEGYASADLPMLYFNYFMETEANPGQDALRVYVVSDDGVEHLVVTNNTILRNGIGDDEFDDPFAAPGTTYDDAIDVDVQRAFETVNQPVVPGVPTTQWRQARVPLGEFAGRSGLSLRIEFSTSGTTQTTSPSIRTISGEALTTADSLEFTVSGETFILELAPSVTFPSGLELASAYAASATDAAVLTIDGQDYVLNDGTRTITTGQIEIDLLAGQPLGTTLEDLSAAAVASIVANQVGGNLAGNLVVPNFNFSDLDDDPTVVGRNDLLFEATPLPYSGGNLTITGNGRLGTVDSDPLVPPTNLDDVDLVRLDVINGTLIEVDVDLDFDPGLDAAIRFFDGNGDELPAILNPANDTVQTTATADGVVYIGISGLGNENYDPRIPGTSQNGQIDSYTASVSVTLPSSIRAEGNTVEFVGGQQSITASPLLTVVPTATNPEAISIPVSRFMSASDVAEEVQRALANRFTFGNMTAIPTGGPSIRLPSFSIDDTGPFVNESDRYAFGANFRAGTANNAFEGVYLDDFIIGFAERGEVATRSNRIDPQNVPDPVNNPLDPPLPLTDFVTSVPFESPAPQTQPTVTGSYQLEIRDASEYVASGDIGLVEQPVVLQLFGGDPIVVPIGDRFYAFRDGTVLVTDIIPKTSPLRAQLSDLNFPTVDIFQNLTGTPISFVDPESVGLVELNDQLSPLNQDVFTPLPVQVDARFRTFDTNDRLDSGFSVVVGSGAQLVDGASFQIADSRGQLTFEFDSDGAPADPAAGTDGRVFIPYDKSDTAAEVATNLVSLINSSNVRALLDVEATRSNTSVATNGFDDAGVNFYGDISFRELVPGFVSTSGFEHRGDTNRDRDEQGVIIIENSRFLFSAESGVEINRDANARVLSPDQRDELPVALTYPANLLELNSEGLIPGVVVQNNVFAYNANTGINIQGLTDGGVIVDNANNVVSTGTVATPVGFDQIINNTLIGGVVLPGDEPGTQVFSDFLFDRGGISFADEIVSANLGPDVDSDFANLEVSLSSADCSGHGVEPANGRFTTSLGTGGSITYRFTDNLLTGNDSPTEDLVIFETGTPEQVRVEISRDGIEFFEVTTIDGTPADSLRREIDLDRFGFDSNDRFAYVRLTDLDSDQVSDQFGAAGADIDAVGAVSTVSAFQYTPGSQGIVVNENAAPTLLNNIVANFQTGIAISGPNAANPEDIDVSRDLTVIGGSIYYRNTFAAQGRDDASTGLFSQTPDPFQQIFVDPTRLIFSPQDHAPSIDSAIDSLEDRASLQTVRSAIGLSPVPILAPSLDLNGQLRVDDPDVDSPVGVGQRVFKDRGAEDSADQTEPRISLISPRGDDRLQDSGSVVTTATVFDAFALQLIDGIVTIDPGNGVGIDDGSVRGSLVRLTQQRSGDDLATTLIEGRDYRFDYEPGDNIIQLTPIAGVWEDDSVYQIELLGAGTGIVQGESGTRYADGALTRFDLTNADRQIIEVDTGINITVFDGALTIVDQNATSPTFGQLIQNIQGQTLEIFDGHLVDSDLAPITFAFELTTTNDVATNNQILGRGAIPVRVGERATSEQIAEALAKAINTYQPDANPPVNSPAANLPQQTLKLYATAVGNRIQIRDAVAKTSANDDVITTQVREPAFQIQPAAAYLGADINLSTRLVGDQIHNKSLRVFDGTSEIAFTLSTNPALSVSSPELGVGSVRVEVSEGSGLAEIGLALKQAIDASALQIDVSVDGNTIVLRGSSGIVDPESTLSFAQPGIATVLSESAFKLTNYSLNVQLTQNAVQQNGTTFASVDGALITIFDGTNQRTFEFDNDGVLNGQDSFAVPVPAVTTPREMIAALVASIDQVEDLDVSIVASSDGFRVTGGLPVSVTSDNFAIAVTGAGELGTETFGIDIPNVGLNAADIVADGQIFTVSVGDGLPQFFEIDFDGTAVDPNLTEITLVSFPSRTLDDVAGTLANLLSGLNGVSAVNVGAGRVSIDGDVRLNLINTGLNLVGIPGVDATIPVVAPLDANEQQMAAAFSSAIASMNVVDSGGQTTQLQQTLNGDRVLIDGFFDSRRNEVVSLEDLRGTSVVTDRIRDEVGNLADADRVAAQRTIFVGGGFDYGDAPALSDRVPYPSTAAQGGPRHSVDTTFALAPSGSDRTVTPDGDALLPNLDEDNGVRVLGSLQPGFSASFEVSVHNENGRDFFVDAWFDWNANGIFEVGEAARFASVAGLPGRSVLGVGTNVISVNVPASAAIGETYARFRLSESSTLGPTGDALSGEVEDIQLIVSNNPFQNPVVQHDVNNNGAITPLDALQIINAIGRNDGNDINLNAFPLPADLPPFPDVSGDGTVSALDALRVINELARLPNSAGGEFVAEGESVGFVQAGNGVLASGATVLGDALIADSLRENVEQAPEIQAPAAKTSVFDSAAVVQLESLVDSLAEDTATNRGDDDENETLDLLFASM
ncbi:MAG: GEVED domain-containing protein [Rubripirellula sp.]